MCDRVLDNILVNEEMTTYSKLGLNPFTQEAIALFDWSVLSAAAPAPKWLPQKSGRLVPGYSTNASVLIWGGTADDGELVVQVRSSALGLSEARNVIVRLSGSASCGTLESSAVVGGEQPEGPPQWSCVADERVECCLGGSGRWLQVDDRIRTYFVSGAYQDDANATATLRHARLAADTLMGAKAERAASLLERSGVQPEDLVQLSCNWVPLIELDGAEGLGVPPGNRLHVLVARDQLIDATGSEARSYCVVELS